MADWNVYGCIAACDRTSHPFLTRLLIGSDDHGQTQSSVMHRDGSSEKRDRLLIVFCTHASVDTLEKLNSLTTIYARWAHTEKNICIEEKENTCKWKINRTYWLPEHWVEELHVYDSPHGDIDSRNVKPTTFRIDTNCAREGTRIRLMFRRPTIDPHSSKMNSDDSDQWFNSDEYWRCLARHGFLERHPLVYRTLTS